MSNKSAGSLGKEQRGINRIEICRRCQLREAGDGHVRHAKAGLLQQGLESIRTFRNNRFIDESFSIVYVLNFLSVC
jgi:hypothetical protein